MKTNTILLVMLLITMTIAPGWGQSNKLSALVTLVDAENSNKVIRNDSVSLIANTQIPVRASGYRDGLLIVGKVEAGKSYRVFVQLTRTSTRMTPSMPPSIGYVGTLVTAPARTATVTAKTAARSSSAGISISNQRWYQVSFPYTNITSFQAPVPVNALTWFDPAAHAMRYIVINPSTGAIISGREYLDPSHGYWTLGTSTGVLVPKGDNLTTSYTTLALKGSYGTVAQQWNLVGNPYGGFISLAGLSIVRNGQSYTLSDASNKGIATPALSWWNADYNGGQGKWEYSIDPDGTLEPNRGYWYLAYQDCQLVIPNPDPGALSFAMGDYHKLVLKSDGTVWAWGRNDYGQLGNGSTSSSIDPVQVYGLAGVSAIAAGGGSSLALKSDGTVWAWGRNNAGQLGNGSTNNSLIPVQITRLNGVRAIAMGYYHSLAVKPDGTIWAWGDNTYGELGTGNITSSSITLQVSGLNGITSIAAGISHSLGLMQDGTVWSWGRNNVGQLGNGTTNNGLVPARVSGLTGVTSIAAGNYHGLAVKQDGTVWAWGYNYDGQLGTGDTTDSLVPIQVSGLSGVRVK